MGKQEERISAPYKVRISVNALLNIYEITDYITFVNEQPLNAIKVGDTIFQIIDRIGQNPLAYKECEELQTKKKIYRRAVCLSWIIVFKIVDFEIIVLGVIHASRRPSKIKALRKVK